MVFIICLYYNEGAGPVSAYFFVFVFLCSFFLFSVQPPEGREIGGRIEEGGEMRSNEKRKGEEMGGGGGG